MTAIIDFPQGWNKINDGAINKLLGILNESFHRDTRPFTNKEYMDIYNVCYKMCTQRTPHNWSEELYVKHGETFRTYLSTTVLSHLRGKTGIYLLQELSNRWDNHKLMNRWMYNFFQYLDRYYVDHHSFPKLEEAGNQHFKENVYEHIKTEVTKAIVGLINDERDGVQIDRALIAKCIEVYQSMNEVSLETYINDFELPLVESTKEYYAKKAAEWIQTDNVPTYLARVEEKLGAEAARVKNYMNERTESPLLQQIEQVALAAQQTKLIENENSGLRALLKEEKREDLSRMYRLYNRLGETGLNPIATIFLEYFREIGLGIVRERESQASNKSSSSSSSNAGTSGTARPAAAERDTADNPAFVVALLDLHDKARQFVHTEFNGHSRFQRALKEAFEVFINKEVESSKYSNAEMIATYCDRVLKTGNTEKLTEAQIESCLDRVVQIFSYIADKDVFGDIYRNQLAKRILSQRSVSNDSERSMMAKLKLRNGPEYTRKMEGMMNDLNTATDLASNFKTWLKKNPSTAIGNMEFSVQVLTMGWWPSFINVNLRLPTQLGACQEVYTNYYNSEKQHRRLQWVHSQGNATVNAVYGKMTYTVSVVTLQAVALLLFNDANGPLTFETIREAMGTEPEVTKKTLHSLFSKVKLLNKIPEGNSINTASDTFEVNAGFTSNLRSLRVPMASLEESHNPKSIEEDRSSAIEACIVRIMKARKTLGHENLVGEVISQLHFFKPNPKLIKKRIEVLIDREYLERDENDAKTYKYLA